MRRMVIYFHLWLDCVRILVLLVLHIGQSMFLSQITCSDLRLGGATIFTLLRSKIRINLGELSYYSR